MTIKRQGFHKRNKKNQELEPKLYHIALRITKKQEGKIYIWEFLPYNVNITNVSLTYLRGLEIAELKGEDMPIV